MAEDKFLGKKVHFIGINGIGMSALAHLLLERGAEVSGSDLQLSSGIAPLRERGAKISEGHFECNVTDADWVIYSTAISSENPELQAARRKAIPVLHRAQLLSLLAGEHELIAVTGSHGKTTTTAMIAWILQDAGLEPTWVLGGRLLPGGANSQAGRGPWWVVEADESDASFLHLRPQHLVITNLDQEHMDYYKSLSHMEEVYTALLERIRPGGCLYWNQEDERLRRLAKGRSGAQSFGCGSNADLRFEVLSREAWTLTGLYCRHREPLGRLRLPLIGEHNLGNAAAALSVALNLGIPARKALVALESFPGLARRCHLRGESHGVRLVDDYAHHPTEVASTLSALAGEKGKGRLVVVFQPHRYSRTQALADSFQKCFISADKVVITDIYAAG
ncbi:MAG: UDP-N-acetylmuramate--L-alanine ligase, partial [Candidatus Omnitrophica bacterium]|nr:UDP-N-acetylmuramate--L-alanine ligase [Candidatus Omnitrophota bacterium]